MRSGEHWDGWPPDDPPQGPWCSTCQHTKEDCTCRECERCGCILELGEEELCRSCLAIAPLGRCPRCNQPLVHYHGLLGYEAARCEPCHFERDLNAESNGNPVDGAFEDVKKFTSWHRILKSGQVQEIALFHTLTPEGEGWKKGRCSTEDLQRELERVYDGEDAEEWQRRSEGDQ